MFYVYTLSDPRCGSVFYVGKGKGARAWQHTRQERSAKGRINRRKSARIRAILDAGSEPVVSIVDRFDDEMAALLAEAKLIAATSGLTNILAGGLSSSYSPEERARLAGVRFEKKARPLLERYLRRWDSWSGVTFPNLRNGDALAREMVETVRAMLVREAPI